MRPTGSRLTRRAFLRRSAWLAAAGVVATLAAGVGGGAIRLFPQPAPADRLAAALGGGAVAARIGLAAVTAGVVPGEASVLIGALRSRIPGLDLILRDGSDDDLRLAIDVARRQDYGDLAGGTVRLGGWVVARTEALACALIAVA